MWDLGGTFWMIREGIGNLRVEMGLRGSKGNDRNKRKGGASIGGWIWWMHYDLGNPCRGPLNCFLTTRIL